MVPGISHWKDRKAATKERKTARKTQVQIVFKPLHPGCTSNSDKDYISVVTRTGGNRLAKAQSTQVRREELNCFGRIIRRFSPNFAALEIVRGSIAARPLFENPSTRCSG